MSKRWGKKNRLIQNSATNMESLLFRKRKTGTEEGVCRKKGGRAFSTEGKKSWETRPGMRSGTPKKKLRTGRGIK